MDHSLDDFAREALRFTVWATESTFTGKDAVREALLRIIQLYSAALNLLPKWDHRNVTFEVGPPQSVMVQPQSLAWKAIPFDMYAEVFDPLCIPSEAPVIGSICDDVSDILRDITMGLHAYKHGDFRNAHWEWFFGFKQHWGNHATSAIRALHAWLAANDGFVETSS